MGKKLNIAKAKKWAGRSNSPVAIAWFQLLEDMENGDEHHSDDFLEECDYLIMDGEMSHSQTDRAYAKLLTFLEEEE